jgi:hypothetical protein
MKLSSNVIAKKKFFFPTLFIVDVTTAAQAEQVEIRIGSFKVFFEEIFDLGMG